MHKGKVTVIEDDESSREMLQLVLGNHYQVACYEDGKTAIKQDVPDVVIIDINMPVMDGVEVIQEIRNDPTLAGLYAIAVSADDTGGRENFLALGFDDYVHKPGLYFCRLMRTVAFHAVKAA